MKLSIKTILLGTFAVVGLLVIGQGGFALRSLSAVDAAVEGIYADQLPSVINAEGMRADLQRVRLAEGTHILAGSNDERSAAEAESKAAAADWQTRFDQYQSVIDPEHVEEAQSFTKIGENFTQLLTIQDELFQLSTAGKRDELVSLFRGRLAELYNEDSALLVTMVDTNVEELQNGRADIGQLYSSTFVLSLVIGGLVLVLAGGVAAFAYFRIGVALARMVAAVRSLAGGDLAVEVPSLATQNEIGDLARAVVTFRELIVERVNLEARAEEERLKKDERERELGEVLRSFETDIVQVVNEVNGETQLMRDTAASLSGIADTTRREAERATSASADASAGIQAIAGTTEELGASISSIAEQAKRASDSVAAAAAVAERADGQVGGLTDAASQIGEVVELISSIARQTNLLALNATIEAARAGEAGRGFAVVASEVKTLAGQTAKATEEISRQVSGIQAASTEAADFDQSHRRHDARGHDACQFNRIRGVGAGCGSSRDVREHHPRRRWLFRRGQGS